MDKMLGIIGAMDEEINGIKKLLSEKKTEKIGFLEYTLGIYNGQKCVVLECGVGKVNAAIGVETMILKYLPDSIICIGIAGGLSSTVKYEDIVIARDTVQYDVDLTSFGNEKGFVLGPNRVRFPCDVKLVDIFSEILKKENKDYHIGTIATGDQFIADKHKHDLIAQEFSAIACDMESGSIGQVCYLHQVPFVVIRSISDDASNSEVFDYIKFKQSASQMSIKVIKNFLDRRD